MGIFLVVKYSSFKKILVQFEANPKSVSSTNFEDRCSGGIPASAIPVLVSNRGYCMDRGSSGEENLYICERKLGEKTN